METFDPRYQESLNGPLSPDLRKRLQRFREENGATLADIGKELGFSGAFISTLLHQKHPANIRTIHISKIVNRVEHAETELGWLKAPPEEKGARSPKALLTLDQHVDAIEAMGYSVTLTRKTR
jgi:transcriptional regulator with XRE-family HTH domain